MVRLVWWSRWFRLSMRSRWSGLPGWSGWSRWSEGVQVVQVVQVVNEFQVVMDAWMTLTYHLSYLETILVHPTRRQSFAGKLHSTLRNI